VIALGAVPRGIESAASPVLLTRRQASRKDALRGARVLAKDLFQAAGLAARDADGPPVRSIPQAMKLGSFSWRLLVGWFLTIFGVAISVLACVTLVTYGLSLALTPSRPLYLVSVGTALVAWLLLFAGGILWWRAGRQILHRKGWWPLLYFAVGYVCVVGGGQLLGKPNFSDVTAIQSGVQVGQE